MELPVSALSESLPLPPWPKPTTPTTPTRLTNSSEPIISLDSDVLVTPQIKTPVIEPVGRQPTAGDTRPCTRSGRQIRLPARFKDYYLG